MNVRLNVVSAFVLALAAATSATADTSQLAASAGLDASEAAGLSLTELVQAKINAEARRDDRQVIVTPVASSDVAARRQLAASAGLTPAEAEAMTVAEIAVVKFDREARGQDRMPTIHAVDVEGGAGREQIVASIGLDPEVGRSMSLHDIYLEKFIRESGDN